MQIISNDLKLQTHGGAGKLSYSKTMNIAFGAATAGSVIDNIFSMVNTAIYLNNPHPQNDINPYHTSKAHIRYGADLKHSGIMLI